MHEKLIFIQFKSFDKKKTTQFCRYIIKFDAMCGLNNYHWKHAQAWYLIRTSSSVMGYELQGQVFIVITFEFEFWIHLFDISDVWNATAFLSVEDFWGQIRSISWLSWYHFKLRYFLFKPKKKHLLRALVLFHAQCSGAILNRNINKVFNTCWYF